MFRDWRWKTLILSFVIFAFCVANNYAQNEKAQTLRDAKFTNIPLKYLLAEFADSGGIPMSFVTDRANDSVSVEIKNATIEDIFNAIVRANPKFAWEKSNGIVRFFPKNNKNQTLQNLLDTKVAKFTIEPNSTVNVVAAKILNSTEIKAALLKSNTNYSSDTNNSSDKKLNTDSPLEFSDLTLQELLDRIVKETKAKFWSIEFIVSQENKRISLKFN